VAVADVNGDGKADLLVTNQGSNTVSVLLGNGNGSFKAAKNFAVGTAPLGVAAGDVNGDGILDLVVANDGSGNVSVLLGNGNGTFGAAKTYKAGTGPSALSLADVNGDGRLDLVVANNGSNTMSVLLGNGNRTFAAAQNFATGTGPAALAVADANGDGRPDLIVANQGSNTAGVLLNAGNGNFTGQLYTITPPAPGRSSRTAADVSTKSSAPAAGDVAWCLQSGGSGRLAGPLVDALFSSGPGLDFPAAGVRYSAGFIPISSFGTAREPLSEQDGTGPWGRPLIDALFGWDEPAE
jgi:hypothetical protein